MTFRVSVFDASNLVSERDTFSTVTIHNKRLAADLLIRMQRVSAQLRDDFLDGHVVRFNGARMRLVEWAPHDIDTQGWARADTEQT